MRFHLIAVAAGVFVALNFSAPLQAAVAPPPWPYAKLMQESDAVAIVVPVSKDNRSGNYGLGPVITKFKVLCWLKGASDGDSLDVTQSLGGIVFINDTRSTIDFLPAGNGKSKSNSPPETREWLAFLKKSPDGTYTPTTAGYTGYSFRELHGIVMYGKESRL